MNELQFIVSLFQAVLLRYSQKGFLTIEEKVRVLDRLVHYIKHESRLLDRIE